MFGLFSRADRRAMDRLRARPQLMALEGREVPAAPILHTLTAQKIGTDLVVRGTVSDENVGGTDSRITTAGTVHWDNVEADGKFTYITPYVSGTTVQARVLDEENLWSNPKGTTIFSVTNAAPVLTMSHLQGSNKMVTLWGKVTDESPGGLSVGFSGAVSGSATTAADGSYSVTIQASSLGTVTGVVYDNIGQKSNEPTVAVTNAAPSIVGFSVSEQPDGYLFTGQVSDEAPGGLTVTFGGDPITLQGRTAITNSDGYFALFVQLNGTTSDNGDVSATVTDDWGLVSAPVLTHVHQSGT